MPFKVQCRNLSKGGKACCGRRDVTNGQAKQLQKKWNLPLCDGTGFPYVKGCYKDMSNWSPHVGQQPKQCIITNPGNSNLSPNSIYTCGFLW